MNRLKGLGHQHGTRTVFLVMAASIIMQATPGEAFRANAPTRPPAVAVRPGQLYDARADVTLSVAQGTDGSIVLTAEGGGLQARKIVFADGRFTVALHFKRDAVFVQATADAVMVTRNGHVWRMQANRLSTDALLRAHVLLAGSPAVQRLRLAAMSLGSDAASAPAGIGFLMMDAFIGFLDGDPAAPSRLAAKWAPSAGTRAGPSMPSESCYDQWEREAMSAWVDYEDCLTWFSDYSPLRVGCAFRWTLEVESAWFHFLGCSTFPWPE